MESERVIQVFFFGFLALIAYELYALLAPFLMPIAWAILLAFMVHPLQLELRRQIRNHTNLFANHTLVAIIITLVVGVTVIGPSIWLSERLVIEAQGLYVQANQFVANGGVARINRWIQHSRYLAPMVNRYASPNGFDLNTDLPKIFMQSAQGTSEYMVRNLTLFARNIVSVVLDFGIAGMVFFYLLRDGEHYYNLIHELTPLHDDDKAAVFDTLTSTLAGVMRGLLLTAVLQGVAIGIGLLVTGVPYWAFLAVAAAASGLLPFGGTAVVWGPAVLYLGYFHSWTTATVLLVWSLIWLIVIDNFIKPIAMRRGTKLPTVALFFGIAGGLEAFGPIGIFGGPAIISVFASLMGVYRRTYTAPRKPRRAAHKD
jgi:predicted PurR-regulated permease PerM